MNDPTFQRLLQSILFDNMYDRYVGHRKTGKLSMKTLSKISFSDKLFKKREERLHKNYSIALLVDCSGSMRDDARYKFAFESAEKLSKHLASAKIPHAIYGFNTVTAQIKPFGVSAGVNIYKKLELILCELSAFWNEETGKYLGHNIDFKNLKTIDRDKIIKGNPWDSHGGSGYNNDSYAVRKVANDLLKEKGTKVMIVLSDGQPAYVAGEFRIGIYPEVPDFPKEFFNNDPYDAPGSKKDLKNEVKVAIKKGVEVHSIGIQTDAVNKYYPADRCCSIYNLSQMYDHIIKIIKLNLKRG